MKITRRQLKKIINEEIQNPCLAAAEKFARLEGNIIVIDGTIKFVTGKTTLKPESYELLDAVVCILNYDGSMPYNGVKVVGHTDSVGSDSMNMNLSQGRAKSVADYLIGAGVNDWRVSSEGLGETNPIAANDTEDGRAKNRRVEFQIVYGVKQRLVPLTQAEPIIPPGAELSAFEKEHGYNPNLMDSRHPDFSKELRANEGVKMKITRRQLRDIIKEAVDSHEHRDFPYHGSRDGKTESQAQQEAAGIALDAVRKWGKEKAIEKLTGAAKEMAHMTLPELDRLATIRRGAEVPDYTHAGKKEEALPKRIEPSPSSLSESRRSRDSKITRSALRKIIKEQMPDLLSIGGGAPRGLSKTTVEKSQISVLPDINGSINNALKHGYETALKLNPGAGGRYDVNIMVDSSNIVSITPNPDNTIDETSTEEITKKIKGYIVLGVRKGDIKLNTVYSLTSSLGAG